MLQCSPNCAPPPNQPHMIISEMRKLLDHHYINTFSALLYQIIIVAGCWAIPSTYNIHPWLSRLCSTPLAIRDREGVNHSPSWSFFRPHSYTYKLAYMLFTCQLQNTNRLLIVNHLNFYTTNYRTFTYFDYRLITDSLQYLFTGSYPVCYCYSPNPVKWQNLCTVGRCFEKILCQIAPR